MKNFFYSLRPAIIAMVIFTLILGVLYPLFIFGIGQLFFQKKANGSLVYSHSGKTIGSELIAQNFTRPEYFHPRPSSAGAKGYDAANSSGSNLGPTSKKLYEAVNQRASTYRQENHLAADVLLPFDAISTSGSGLDPHISLENAKIQAARIAQARSLRLDNVYKLIDQNTEASSLKIFGPPYVNVLKLNLALDKLCQKNM